MRGKILVIYLESVNISPHNNNKKTKTIFLPLDKIQTQIFQDKWTLLPSYKTNSLTQNITFNTKYIKYRTKFQIYVNRWSHFIACCMIFKRWYV